MPNAHVNKVVYGSDTLIDLTSDTAMESDVAAGKYFHLATGERVCGTMGGNRAPSEIVIYGKSEQNGTPTPSAPVAIQSVSGTINLFVSDGTDTSSTSIALQGHELRSLQDGTCDELRLTYDGVGTGEGFGRYKATLVQNVGSIVFDGTESWLRSGGGSYRVYTSAASSNIRGIAASEVGAIMSTHFEAKSASATYTGTIGVALGSTTDKRIYITPTGSEVILADYKTWLADNTPTVDYPLETAQEFDLGTVELAIPIPSSANVYVSTTPSTSVSVSYGLLLQSKTATPTTSQQTVTADSGYDGLGSVMVDAIPSQYVVPSGNKAITENGNGIDVAAYASVDVAVPSCWELIASTTLNDIARTSTSAATAGTIALGSSAFTATDMIWVHVRDTAGVRAGYFYGSDSLFVNANKATGSTSTFSAPAIETIRCTTAGALAGYSGGYGVWGYSISSSGTLTIRMRYNSNYSLTIDGDYKVDVYRLTPPDGIVLFPE